MDPALSLALGILVFVLTRSCYGTGWIFFLPIALGAAIAIWAVHQASTSWKRPAQHDFVRTAAPTMWRNCTSRAKSLEVSNT